MNRVSSARFGLALLGRFELTGPAGVVDVPSKKLAGVLTYLACTAPRPQRRETLSALLWAAVGGGDGEFRKDDGRGFPSDLAGR